jgi:hypothetical protein
MTFKSIVQPTRALEQHVPFRFPCLNLAMCLTEPNHVVSCCLVHLVEFSGVLMRPVTIIVPLSEDLPACQTELAAELTIRVTCLTCSLWCMRLKVSEELKLVCEFT